MKANCYICGSGRFVDDHHIDCVHGAKSDKTVPLCRRCHRTYHDIGIEWFDDELLDKALQIENRRRDIYGLPHLTRGQVKRSEYWNKKHGIKPAKVEKPKLFSRRGFAPLCGWDWFWAHLKDSHPEQSIEVKYDDKVVANVATSDKPGMLRRILKEVRK